MRCGVPDGNCRPSGPQNPVCEGLKVKSWLLFISCAQPYVLPRRQARAQVLPKDSPQACFLSLRRDGWTWLRAGVLGCALSSALHINFHLHLHQFVQQLDSHLILNDTCSVGGRRPRGMGRNPSVPGAGAPRRPYACTNGRALGGQVKLVRACAAEPSLLLCPPTLSDPCQVSYFSSFWNFSLKLVAILSPTSRKPT